MTSAASFDLDAFLTTLLQALTPERAQALIAQDQSLIGLLPAAHAELVATELRKAGASLRLLGPAVVLARIRKLRPDLAPALERGHGRRWLGREVLALKRLAREGVQA